MGGNLTRQGKMLLSVLLVSVWLGGCSTNPATGKRQLVFISRQQEIAMGEEAAPEFEKEFGGSVQDDLLQSYVQMVGQKFAAVSDRE
ncbi:MAG: hypothetical protein ACYSTL_07000, partial [Planctomycetota bacterium]